MTTTPTGASGFSASSAIYPASASSSDASSPDAMACRNLLDRHVSPEVASQAIANAPNFGGEAHEASIIFIDLVDSTGLSANSSPAEVFEILNGFFTVIIEVVHSHGGWVNKFIGDAALCVLGVPTRTTDHASQALDAGS